MSETITPFEFHTGMHFAPFTSSNNEQQWKGVCPFCRKPGHFFFGTGPTWGWSCKSCQMEGNIYTFLKHVYADLCTNQLVDVLAMFRGISLETMTRDGIKYNEYNQSYVIPTYNEKGSLNYLYKVIQSQGKFQILNIPGLDPTLFSWPKVIHQTIWLCEGPWDKMASEDIIGPTRNITPLGFPGATFKQSWCNLFGGATLVILQDNDSAGEKIRDRIIQRIANSPVKPERIYYIRWPEGTKPKYDINDLLRDRKHTAYEFILDHLVENDVADAIAPSTDIIADTSCLTFLDLEEACKEIYHFTDDMRMLMQLLIACLYSLKIEGEQLWVRVIGPPGSSKTTMAKIAGSSEQSLMRSTFTGLLSGWKDDDPKDASLIPIISGKLLIVKDGDALLQQPNIAKILSELRDFYDKSISATFLNRVSYEYNNVRSGFCFCGTHALRNMDNSALGERFLDFELKVNNEDRQAISKRSMETAIQEAMTGRSMEPSIAAKAKNFIDNIVLNTEGVATLHNDDKRQIEMYGNVISYLRAKVERNRSGEIAYKPLPEVPSRIIKQMVKLFQCAPIIINKQEPDTSTIALGRKLTLDIIDTSAYRYRICDFLRASPKQSIFQLVEALQIPVKIIEREMDNMHALEMLKIDKVWSGPGTAVRTISLREDIESQVRELIQGPT